MKSFLSFLFLILIVIGISAMDSEGIGLVIAVVFLFSGLIGVFVIENVYIPFPRHQHKDKYKKVA